MFTSVGVMWNFLCEVLFGKSNRTELEKRKKLRNELLEEIQQELTEKQNEIRLKEIEAFVGKYVIAITNEWEDPIIGYGKDIVSSVLGSGSIVWMLEIEDFLSKRTVRIQSAIYPFSDVLLLAMTRLDPYERWMLHCKSHYCRVKEKDFKPVMKYLEIKRKLKENGFYSHKPESALI